MKSSKFSRILTCFRIIGIWVAITNIDVYAQTPGLSTSSPFYSLTENGVASFSSLFNHILSTPNSNGNCFIQSIGSTLQHLHETVLNEFGEVIMYASETTSKYLYPNNRTLLENADIEAKRFVQATTLRFIFPEKDIEDFEPQEWLSNSTYMPYITSYLTGLDLNTSFPAAGECIGNTIGFIDKTVQFQNNLSLSLNYTRIEEIRLAYPALNFTGMIANHMALIPVDCFDFWRQFQYYWEDLFERLDNSMTIFL